MLNLLLYIDLCRCTLFAAATCMSSPSLYHSHVFYSLLTSTNGSESLLQDLPACLYSNIETGELNKQKIDSGEWKKYVKCENGVLPFLSFAKLSDAMEAEHDLDIFTMEVLIPLCERTNAVVICSSSRACSLGMSFARAANFLASTNRHCAFFKIQVLYNYLIFIFC